MSSLRNTVLSGSNKDKAVLSIDQVAQAALCRRNAEAMQQRKTQVGQIAVALEGKQEATGMSKLPETEDEVLEAFVTREQAIFMDLEHEYEI